MIIEESLDYTLTNLPILISGSNMSIKYFKICPTTKLAQALQETPLKVLTY